MEERFVAMPSEAPPAPPATDVGGGAGPLDDPRTLQILSTEHWALLAGRSLVYNEAFARAGMFLSFLSATLVALGLIATVAGFNDGFLMIAAVLLAIDVFIGFASLGRIASASAERRTSWAATTMTRRRSCPCTGRCSHRGRASSSTGSRRRRG